MTSPSLADDLHARIRSAHETADRARRLLAWTHARLRDRCQLREPPPHYSPILARRTATRRQSGTGTWTRRRLTGGNEPLERTALVAITRCGHWWMYPVQATIEQMDELARFNLGIVCSFCLAAWQDATHARACGTAWRVN